MFFFFNDTATTEIYTLSLHDALPISESYVRSELAGAEFFARLKPARRLWRRRLVGRPLPWFASEKAEQGDRKSTRLNSSHSQISYAVFCLKKKTWLHNDLHNARVSIL